VRESVLYGRRPSERSALQDSDFFNSGTTLAFRKAGTGHKGTVAGVTSDGRSSPCSTIANRGRRPISTVMWVFAFRKSGGITLDPMRKFDLPSLDAKRGQRDTRSS
jgi:hypothetical protein